MILDMKNKPAFIFPLVNTQLIKKYPGCKSIVNSYTKAILTVPAVEFWQFIWQKQYRKEYITIKLKHNEN